MPSICRGPHQSYNSGQLQDRFWRASEVKPKILGAPRTHTAICNLASIFSWRASGLQSTSSHRVKGLGLGVLEFRV